MLAQAHPRMINHLTSSSKHSPELWPTKVYICDPLSENLPLPANIEFKLEAILSVQVVFQLNSDYCTKVLQGACTIDKKTTAYKLEAC